MIKNIFSVAILLLLSACGFEPLYAQKKPETNSYFYFSGDFDTSVTDFMATIKVEPIPDRVGQILRNQLLDSLNPLGQPQSPNYRLSVAEISLQETEQALRSDITATRIKVKYTAKYKLIDKENKIILDNDAVAYASFDVLSSPYSSTISRKKTNEEAMKIIANDITLRLGSYFHSIKEKDDI
ncbi:MAG: LPS assembly lipoprotein LptE [Alphaproteobacteria bacterium]